MLDTVITGAQVVTASGVAELDVGIAGERIATLSRPGSLVSQADRVIHAEGLILVPGGIEPHAHLHHPVRIAGEESMARSQSPEAGTGAAAFGGTTTVLDFAFPNHGSDAESVWEVADERRGEFAGRSYTDFAFHSVITPAFDRNAVAGMREAVDHGVASFKVFTSGGPRRRRPPHMIDTGRLETVIRLSAELGSIVAVHAEEEDMVCEHVDRLHEAGDDGLTNLPVAHSALSEEIAFQKVLSLGQSAHAALYFMHVSAHTGVKLVRRARGHEQPVFGEVLHNFLAYTSEVYGEDDGALYHTFPGLKHEEDRGALWSSLQSSALSCLATDDYTMPHATKIAGRTIGTVCGGHAGIETRAMYLFSEGYRTGKLSLPAFADATATNAARIFGLYPRKGVIAVGSDADLVLWDPSISKTLTLADMHHDSDYSIWDGWTMNGMPVMTMVRGATVVDGGQLVAERPAGTWLKRELQDAVRNGPAC